MPQIFQRQAETFLERKGTEQEDAELSPEICSEQRALQIILWRVVVELESMIEDLELKFHFPAQPVSGKDTFFCVCFLSSQGKIAALAIYFSKQFC